MGLKGDTVAERFSSGGASCCSALSRMSNQYHQASYWDNRFKGEDEFDWYHKWKPTLKEELEASGLTPESKILVIGCGNSSLSRDMYDDGYENITNIDFSINAIQSMQVKNNTRLMDWHHCDVMDMSNFCDDNGYDFVIDNGCIDSILCGSDDKSTPPVGPTKRVKAALAEVFRVLKPGGKFVSESFADDREQYYEDPEAFIWSGGPPALLEKPKAANVAVNGGLYYFMYTYTKN